MMVLQAFAMHVTDSTGLIASYIENIRAMRRHGPREKEKTRCVKLCKGNGKGLLV